MPLSTLTCSPEKGKIIASSDIVLNDAKTAHMALPLTATLARATRSICSARGIVGLPSMLLLVFQYSDQTASKKGNIYNVLWVLVFGFATLNILGLIARRFEPRKSNLNFGEILAITVVFVSVFLLGWEMLYLFHVLPIKLEPR